MSKKRTKQNQRSNEKLALSQHRNDFFKKLGIFCKTLTGEDILKLIPQNELERIYFNRTRSISVEPYEGHDIQPIFIEVVRKAIQLWMKQILIPVEKTNKTTSLADMYLMGITLYVYLLNKENTYKNSQTVRELLESTCGDIDYLFDIIYDKLKDEVFPFLITITNNLCQHYFSFSLFIGESDDARGIKFRILVKKYLPDKIDITLDNNTRPAYRIGWTFNTDEFEWLYVTPLQLGIETAFANLPIPVYIQTHALQRLIERIDCIHFAFSIAGIYFSLREMNVIHDNNKFIIELKVLNVKVGYLSAIMLDGRLIIRTFLFLTYNGTPEGKRLEEYIGLQKLDTKFLKMDKLSSFMSGKLNSNDELRFILKKADCLHLLELYDQLDQFSAVHLENSPVEMLIQYLKDSRTERDNCAFDD